MKQVSYLVNIVARVTIYEHQLTDGVTFFVGTYVNHLAYFKSVFLCCFHDSKDIRKFSKCNTVWKYF